MTRYKLLIFCVLSSFLSIAQNQPKIDSLLQILKTDISDRHRVDIYVDIARNYQGLYFKKINTYGNKAIVLSKKIDYAEGEIDALYYMGGASLKQEKFAEAEQLFIKMLDLANKNNDHKARTKAYRGLGRVNRGNDKMYQALDYFFKSLEINQELGYKDEQAMAYNAIGILYRQQKKHHKALEYHLLSLNLFEQLGNKNGMTICYMNMGILYRKNKNPKKSINYFSRSIKLHKSLNQEIKAAYGYINLGQTYYQIKDYKKALDYFFKSLNILKGYSGQKLVIVKAYTKMAKTYIALRDYEKALEYSFKSLKIYEDSSLDIKKPLLFYNIGQIYNIQNQTELARRYTNQGIVSAQKQGLLKDIRNGAKQLAFIEKKSGNYKKAYEVNTLWMQMTDSLYNDETVRKIAKIEAKYEFQKEKDSLNLLRQQEIILDKEKIKQRKNRSLIIYVFTGLSLIIGIVCFIIIYKALQRKKIRLLRNRISRDLHDEIGSTLSSIALYGTVASSNIIKDPKKTSELLTLINSYSSSTIESMNDIVWAINSDEDSIRDLISRMRSFASEIEDTKRWKIGIHYKTEIIDRSLNMIQRRNMYLIFKEALNNALKYSNGKEIQVDIDIVNNLITLDIKDDGRGFELDNVIEKNKSFGGNGLKNMKMRAEELDGKLTIHSILEQGTKVNLEFNMSH